MKNWSPKAFTLSEMLVVIALLLLLLTFVYLPYAHYQEKLKVRQAVREVSQSIIEVRNLAINGIDMKEDENDPNSLYENKSVWLYLSGSSMQILAYPHEMMDENEWNIDRAVNDTLWIKLYKPRELPRHTKFEAANAGSITDMGNILFFYDAVSGEGKYYSWDSSWNRSEINWADHIELNFSFKSSSSPILNKKMTYDTRVNIVDY